MSIEIDKRVLGFLQRRSGRYVSVKEISLGTHTFEQDVHEALANLAAQGLVDQQEDKWKTDTT